MERSEETQSMGDNQELRNDLIRRLRESSERVFSSSKGVVYRITPIGIENQERGDVQQWSVIPTDQLTKILDRLNSTPVQPIQQIPVSVGESYQAKVDQSEVDSEAQEHPEDPAKYDFDLAEFPLFRFYKNRLAQYDPKEPIVYMDTIAGKDGMPVAREWKVYPRAGVGGPSTHALLFDLLQMYVEQGCRGSQIHFGTLRALFQRQGNRNPSKRDYERMRRDIEILCAYRIQCKNSFWDKEKQAYVDMNWNLFNNVFYFKEKPNDTQMLLPFGFIEVNQVLQQIARTRGFFATGFAPDFFHLLTPMEQRLSLYLAKFFMFQEVHYRFVDIIAKALPIESKRDIDVRIALKNAAEGLLEKNLPILKSYCFEKSAEGRWKVLFYRKIKPGQDYKVPKYAAEELSGELEYDVDRIIEATGNADDKPWWIQCSKRLGHCSVDRALGQLKETCQLNKVKNKGAMLTKIFKDLARERGLALTDT